METLGRQVGELGYVLHDVERGGEKGFHRIDEGFTTRPDSRAMKAHFEAPFDGYGATEVFVPQFAAIFLSHNLI